MPCTVFICFFILILTSNIFGQSQLYRKNQFDIEHYKFELKLSDHTDTIYGTSTIDLTALKQLSLIELDLVQTGDYGFGMTVTTVHENAQEVSFRQENDILYIHHPFESGHDYQFTIVYQGIPEDGLIIGQNKYGNRTFFGDNWPNRARHWLPSIDHPSDKASVEFVVDAPDHYEVIATGKKIEESSINGGRKLTHYSCSNPMPTKVMVIGVAQFAIKFEAHVHGHEVSSWIYPEDRKTGFDEYAPAVPILQYFIDKIGPYPNTKLANVQSKTRYGGMENAGNIFYFEGSIDGQVDDHNLIAHEIAHQWFGNSASEMDWHHVWLSEGFATYLTDVYIEDHQGRDSLNRYLDATKE